MKNSFLKLARYEQIHLIIQRTGSIKDKWKVFENGPQKSEVNPLSPRLLALDEEREREKKELAKQRQARWKEREDKIKKEEEERIRREAETLERKTAADERRKEIREEARKKRVRITG